MFTTNDIEKYALLAEHASLLKMRYAVIYFPSQEALSFFRENIPKRFDFNPSADIVFLFSEGKDIEGLSLMQMRNLGKCSDYRMVIELKKGVVYSNFFVALFNCIEKDNNANPFIYCAAF